MTRLNWATSAVILAAVTLVVCLPRAGGVANAGVDSQDKAAAAALPPEAAPIVVEFADFAFPPTVSDVDYHEDAWLRDDCLRCHETGVGDAPVTKHAGMPEILLSAKCRSCHVLIPGQKPVVRKEAEEGDFASFAFPPMIPASESHKTAWMKDDCLLCHEEGTKGAPVVKHESAHLPRILLKSKCRTCHVQVRAASFLGG